GVLLVHKVFTAFCVPRRRDVTAPPRPERPPHQLTVRQASATVPPMETRQRTRPACPRIISVDDHTVEPPDVWKDRLPRRYHDTGPRIVRAPLEEMSFLGGRFKPVMGAPGDDGPLGARWVYEDPHRPHPGAGPPVGVRAAGGAARRVRGTAAGGRPPGAGHGRRSGDPGG